MKLTQWEQTLLGSQVCQAEIIRLRHWIVGIRCRLEKWILPQRVSSNPRQRALSARFFWGTPEAMQCTIQTLV